MSIGFDTFAPPPGANLTPSAPSFADAAESGSEVTLFDDFDTFLTLLTTQLQNQDPTSPLDTNQVTDQLVQFASVEQSIQTNELLEELVEINGNDQVNLAAALIGNEAEVVGNTGIIDGPGDVIEFTYSVPGGVSDLQLTVFDEDGSVVRSVGGTTEFGRQDFVFDGLNNLGEPVDPGVFFLQAQAIDSAGAPVPIAITSIGRIDGVLLENGEAQLDINGGIFNLDDILFIRDQESSQFSFFGSQ